MKPLSFFLSMCFALSAAAQKPHQPSSAEIYQQIKQLDVLGKVLYLAAHPDDENTRFISYCANEKLYETAYLSLTRGDGGQNLVGPEIREELGIIRTQELLAARRIDGRQQFFTRANDFGYSKTSEETQQIWDRDKVLSDMVWVVRNFRPDVIVCRFPPDSRGGHGHHTASAQLGLKVFEMAADPTAFPEQLKHTSVWQARRIVVNTGRWWNENISANDPGVVAEDIGQYIELLGTSCNEIAALSRSQHKSQGFGSSGKRGEQLEYFEHLKGEQADKSLFDGINASWSRVEGMEDVATVVDQLQERFDFENPSGSIPLLIKLREMLDACPDKHWRAIKQSQIDELIKDVCGLYLEAVAHDHSASKGDSLHVAFEFINRSPVPITVKRVLSSDLGFAKTEPTVLEYNRVAEVKYDGVVKHTLPVSQPYWLQAEGKLGYYEVKDPLMRGKPENDPAIQFVVTCEIAGKAFEYTIPLVYKWNDPVKGEQYRPFVVTPPVFVNFEEPIYVFTEDARTMDVIVKAGKPDVHGRLFLAAPEGWELNQNEWDLRLKTKGEEQRIAVTLTPSKKAVNGKLEARFELGEQQFNRALNTIEYDHIPTQVWFPNAETQLAFIDIKSTATNIGYFEGAGDVVPEALENIGLTVTRLTEADITLENLKQFHTIVLGIRAINVNERIGFVMPTLLQYVEQGGTLVLQYNTSHRQKSDNWAPYPIRLSRERVTEEDAQVTFLDKKHPVLTQPNKLSEADFDGWVQERGLYFPDAWEEDYQTVLSWHDKGEDAKTGSLLVAEYGEGHYVYTGISFFRQLPAGVPGAYRLLANIISLGN